MNCPYCNKEMERGFIQSPHQIDWTHKKHSITSAFDNDSIILSETNFFKGSVVVAYCCKDCKKIIIDYTE